MDINDSPLSRYKTDKRGISRFVSGTPSSSIKGKEASGSSEQRYNQPDLKAGQTIRGQIIDRRYNEVLIRIEPGNQVITARLSGNLPLSIGQEADFQLSEGANDSLLLKYLPVDMDAASDALIFKALTASGLGATDKNRAIVQELLDQNMPIDKHTLQSLIKQSLINREASPQTLVLMYKNNIPMTPENIRQFEIYQNGTNKLIRDIQEITGRLSDLLMPEGKSPAAANENPVTYTQSCTSENVPTPNSSFSHSSTTTPEIMQSYIDPTLHNAISKLLRMNAGMIDILYQDNAVRNAGQFQDKAILPASPATAAGTLIENPTTEVLPALSADAPIQDILKPSEVLNLSEYMKSLPDNEGIREETLSGTIELQRLLTYISQNLSDTDLSSVRLLQSPEYSHLLEQAFLNRWTVSPEELSKKTPVQELYQNLHDDIDKLNQLVRAFKDDEASLPIREPLKNLQENVSFLKDLNDMFTYLQLPVRLKDRNLHSELYVYTRKGLHKDTQASVSVLLHLDMEHLGPLNIYVELKQNLIQAKFYTADNATGLLLGNQIPLLDETLGKRGYKLQTEIMNTYKEPDFVKDFIAQDFTDSSVKRYTFDIRT